MRVLNMVLAAVVFVLGAAGQAWADSLYFAAMNPNATYKFGTVDSAGNKTTIATGLNYGSGGPAEKLMFAPDGTLYGFDVSYAGGSGAWGRINPATGAFTQIGNLNTYFPGMASDHTETGGFSLAFGPSGSLYVTGYGTDSRYDYGTLDVTTGAFTKISASPLGQGFPGSLASAIPEPSTFALLVAGAVGFLAYACRRHTKAS
jgi:hypothetical protein